MRILTYILKLVTSEEGDRFASQKLTWNLKNKEGELKLPPEKGLITIVGGLLAAVLPRHSLWGHNYNVVLQLNKQEVGYGKL
jgi:hypothetical protein